MGIDDALMLIDYAASKLTGVAIHIIVVVLSIFAILYVAARLADEWNKRK